MPDSPWWRDAVVYQVYPRSFADSDGDGHGDLAGVTAHLPYLAELGVDALWLCPFYPSPGVDGGYDITDHCDVAPEYGTLADIDTPTMTTASSRTTNATTPRRRNPIVRSPGRTSSRAVPRSVVEGPDEWHVQLTRRVATTA